MANTLMTVVGIDLKSWDAGLRQLNKDLKAMEKDFTGLQQIGKRLSDMGKYLTAGVTLPIMGAAVAATKFATDFNASMANVATLIPGNTARVTELKRTVQDLSVTTAKSTEDLAGGLYQVISAFGDTAETAKTLELNAKAAAAGIATTADAINLTSAVTKGYGDTSAQAVQRASDLAFATVRLGQTTFPELSASIGRVVPLASSLKVSQEELFAVMATGTGVTGNATEVSTQLRGILQSLMAPTDSMATLVEKMGFSSGKAMVEQVGLKDSIDLIMRAAEKSGQPLQKFISSIEGQTLALALAGPQAESFKQKLREMGASAGATDQAFKDQTEGVNKLGFQLQQAKNEAIVMAQKLGDALAPALLKALEAGKPLIDTIKAVVDWFVKLPPGAQNTILTLTALAAAIGPVLIVAGTLMESLGKIRSNFELTKDVIGGVAKFLMAHPLLLAIAAIGTAVYLLYTAWTENWGGIRDVVKEVVDWVGDKIEKFVGFFRDMKDKVLSFLGFGREVREKGQELGESLYDGVKQGLDMHSPSNVERAFGQVATGTDRELERLKAMVDKAAPDLSKKTGKLKEAVTSGINEAIDLVEFNISRGDKLWELWKSQFEGAASSIEYLQREQQHLTDRQAQLQRQLELTRKEVEALTRAKGANHDETRRAALAEIDLQIQLAETAKRAREARSTMGWSDEDKVRAAVQAAETGVNNNALLSMLRSGTADYSSRLNTYARAMGLDLSTAQAQFDQMLLNTFSQTGNIPAAIPSGEGGGGSGHSLGYWEGRHDYSASDIASMDAATKRELGLSMFHTGGLTPREMPILADKDEWHLPHSRLQGLLNQAVERAAARTTPSSQAFPNSGREPTILVDVHDNNFRDGRDAGEHIRAALRRVGL